MYWPLGAPRVYAAKKRLRTSSPGSEEELFQNGEEHSVDDGSLLELQISRGGHLFASITSTTLDIWQTSPVVLLASVVRSTKSLQTHGDNISVLLRPDASIAAVQTSLGFLVTYSISVDPQTRVHQQQRRDEKTRRLSIAGRYPIAQEVKGQPELHVRFRMVIKIDAGIVKAVALDDELLVATEKPVAVQCIRWAPDSAGIQTSTELVHRLSWMNKKSNVVDIIHDRAMSLFVWITGDGRAYAVQRNLATGATQPSETPRKLFRGYGFHSPDGELPLAIKAAINARFSLLALGCDDGVVHVYTARDYAGNIPLSHKLIPPISRATTGPITVLIYSPDGYCLFVGYEYGWLIWSVYGKLGGSSFVSNTAISQENKEGWLMGVQSGSWINAGSELLFTGQRDYRIWVLELVKSAVTGCYCPANVSRMLLHTSSKLLIDQKHLSLDMVSPSADASHWHEAQIPRAYLANQSPLRCVVISPDGRYVAVAGRRGLAHYSGYSGRWKTFDNPEAENAFAVRGGMCWYQHILIAAVEVGDRRELRLYSRELGLSETSLLCIELLSSPAVTITPSGEDSLLVYTYENILFHYIITSSTTSVKLVQVGQIGLHGIVRAPARVRAVTWYIPEHQLLDGDPSQDVVQAAVLFLVDAKLVLLQPNKDDPDTLKYDMRIIANDVEYFNFTRDQYPFRPTPGNTTPSSATSITGTHSQSNLQDSLWYFDGQRMQCWPDFHDILKSAFVESNKDLPKPISITTDFYPTSIELTKGVVVGLEPHLVQRRDTAFAFFRLSARTQLFLPPILRHYLSTFDSSSALSLSHHYQRLSYFPHALEVLLHTVLDEEVDSPLPAEAALLPTVLSFLSSFPDYLDILVQCTRKTEVRSWGTLYAHLPPPQELFRESLEKGLLKTAAGYLLVLHAVEELDTSSVHCVLLLQRAKEAGDFELCQELARFLMALDESGDRLREALQQIDLNSSTGILPNGHIGSQDGRLRIPLASVSLENDGSVLKTNGNSARANSRGRHPGSATFPEDKIEDAQDTEDQDQGYFSSRSR